MWIGILATLGKLAMAGKVGPGVAVALYLANGIQFHFFPEFTVDLYKVTVPLSPLGTSMLKMVGAVMCTTGVYLGALAAGASAAEAFAAMYLFTAAVTAKFALTECDAVGVPKFGPLAWAGLSIALAAAALM